MKFHFCQFFFLLVIGLGFVMLSLSWILINSVALITADVIAACFFVIYHLMHLVGINEIYYRQS